MKEKDPNDPGFQKYLQKTSHCKKCGVAKDGNGSIGLYFQDGVRAKNSWKWKNPKLWESVTPLCKWCAKDLTANKTTEVQYANSNMKGPNTGEDSGAWLFQTLLRVRELWALTKGLNEPVKFQELVDDYQAYVKKINELA